MQTRLTSATARLAADREFCKALLTLSIAMIGVYVTLITWALPKGTASIDIRHLDGKTVACLALPALDFALALVAFALGYVGAGFGRTAPSTLTEMQDFHDTQVRWMRAGGIFLLIGLLTAFAMLARFLIKLDKATGESLEHFAATASILIALAAVRSVAQEELRSFFNKIFLVCVVGMALFIIADTWGVAVAGVIVGSIPVAALVALALAIAYIIIKGVS